MAYADTVSRGAQLGSTPAKTVVPAGFSLGHRPCLDGLRGIGVSCVIFAHLGWRAFDGAAIVMDLFFVLSGFLITALLMQEFRRAGRISLRDFYIRRALRILPALLSLLVVAALYAVFQPKQEAVITLRNILVTLFYVGNWLQAFSPHEVLGPLNHTWSLSVEEQFYTLWPLALVGMLAWGLTRRWMLGLIVIAAAASAIHRAAMYESAVSYPRVYFALDTRGDALLIGCALGLIASWNLLPSGMGARRSLKILSWCCALFAATVVAVSEKRSPYLFEGLLTLASLAYSGMILEMIVHPDGGMSRFFGWRGFTWLGQLSYGLYLWHYPIFRQFTGLQSPPVVVIALQLSATLVVAYGSYHLIEQPFLSMKGRLTRDGRRREQQRPAASASVEIDAVATVS